MEGAGGGGGPEGPRIVDWSVLIGGGGAGCSAVAWLNRCSKGD
jgi:hypothetical protein